MGDIYDEDELARRLRAAGARFGFVFGSRAHDSDRQRHPGSDLDIAAWWGSESEDEIPEPWEVSLGDGIDLVVLDRAPLWLAGRVAMNGRVLFDDDPAARVAWQADTRLVYLDELPALIERQREWRAVIGRG